MLKKSANPPRRAAIIVAAGRGTRAGGDVPKQYRRLGRKTVLQHSIDAFVDYGFDHIVIVVAPSDEWHGGLTGEGLIFAEGGATRTESVKNGMIALKSHDPDLVFIHDGARPFVSSDLLGRIDDALSRSMAVVPALQVVDAIKEWNEDTVGADVERESLRRVQTPQAFHFREYLSAITDYEEASSDDITVARAAGMHVGWVDGDDENFKLTYPADFARAERALSSTRVGLGYDVHRIGDGDGVWLCGIFVPCDFSLIGHSDADVGLHAITDAVLGACALGDIGDHFPPSDPQWKGAASDQFLRHAVQLSDARLDSIDVTIVCERPKIKPHRQSMRERIADICGVEVERVSVKATTTEGLGFEGRGEGISAQAVVSLRL